MGTGMINLLLSLSKWSGVCVLEMNTIIHPLTHSINVHQASTICQAWGRSWREENSRGAVSLRTPALTRQVKGKSYEQRAPKMEAGRKGRLTQDDLFFGITRHLKEEEMEAQEILTAGVVILVL